MAVNSYTGNNSYTGVSGLQGVNQYSNANAGNPLVSASNITDSGLRDYLTQQNLFKPVNSYQTKEVARLNDLQNAAKGYGVSSSGSSGSSGSPSYGGPETWTYGDTGYGRRDLGTGYSYEILGADGGVLGTGYYDTRTALDNELKKYVTNQIIEEERPNYYQQAKAIDPSLTSEGAWNFPQEMEWVANSWAPKEQTKDQYGRDDYASTTRGYTYGGGSGFIPIPKEDLPLTPEQRLAGHREEHQNQLSAPASPGVRPNGHLGKMFMNGGGNLWLASQLFSTPQRPTITRNPFITKDSVPTDPRTQAEQAAYQDMANMLKLEGASDLELLEYYSQAIQGKGANNSHGGNSVGMQAREDYMAAHPDEPMFNQMMNAPSSVDFSADQYAKYINPTTKGNKKADPLKGEYAMVGSTPVFDKSGKVIGYKFNTYDPMEWKADVHESYKTGSGIDKSTNSFNAVGGSYAGQQFNDPDWWSKNVYKLPNGGYFMAAGNVAGNPGYNMADDYQLGINDYEKKAGFVSQLGKAATGMVLGAAFGAGGAALGGLGGAAGASAGQALGGALPGMAMGAANGQDWQGILKNAALSSAGGYLGAQYGGDLGNALGGGEALGKALIKGGISAGGAALRGGSAGEILTSGALGGLGSYGNAVIGDLTEGMDPLARQLISAGYGGILGGVGSNLSGGSFANGALSSLAGSLGGAAVNSLAPGYGNLGSAFGTALLNNRIRKRRKT